MLAEGPRGGLSGSWEECIGLGWCTRYIHVMVVVVVVVVMVLNRDRGIHV